jgi:acetoin utilization protein AcuC
LRQEDVQEVGSIFVYSDELAWFDFGPEHPYKPERAYKTYELCTRYGVMNQPWMQILEPKPIVERLLLLFHEPDYIRLLKKASAGEVCLEMLEHGLGSADNPILPGIYEWSLRAAGGTHEAMERIMNGDALVAFNPLDGFHHGMPGYAEGFCYINDIAVAIIDALNRFPEQRIAYVDIDAHHANGVQQAFYTDPRVLVMSLHETGRVLYPGSGSETEIGDGEGKGFTINLPLEAGSDDEVYDFVLDDVVFPILKSLSPDIVVAQIGADTLLSDPLTDLKCTNNAYQRAIKGITEHCPKILALGGGGYDIYRTARCWTLAWSILNRVEPMDEFAGLVGGMMFGPEKEVGSLYDHTFRSKGEIKDKALQEAQRVTAYIRKVLFPIHGI